MGRKGWIMFAAGLVAGGLLTGLAWVALEFGPDLRPPLVPKEKDCNAIDVTLMEVNWDGWPALQLENQFNQPPQEMERILMIRVRVDYVAERTAGPMPLAASHFSLRGDKGTVYKTFNFESRCGVVPDALDATLEPGDRARGNLCYRIPKDEGNLVLYVEPTGCGVTNELPVGSPETW